MGITNRGRNCNSTRGSGSSGRSIRISGSLVVVVVVAVVVVVVEWNNKAEDVNNSSSRWLCLFMLIWMGGKDQVNSDM